MTSASTHIRFYMQKGRWRVTSDKHVVPAVEWWAAVNHVKCLNHRLREAERLSRLNQQAELNHLRQQNQPAITTGNAGPS